MKLIYSSYENPSGLINIHCELEEAKNIAEDILAEKEDEGDVIYTARLEDDKGAEVCVL